MTKWHSIKESMPWPPERLVLVASGLTLNLAYYNPETDQWLDSEWFEIPFVTHWAEPPKLPGVPRSVNTF